MCLTHKKFCKAYPNMFSVSWNNNMIKIILIAMSFNFPSSYNTNFRFFAAFCAKIVSSVFPEYDDDITRVFSFTKLGIL